MAAKPTAYSWREVSAIPRIRSYSPVAHVNSSGDRSSRVSPPDSATRRRVAVLDPAIEICGGQAARSRRRRVRPQPAYRTGQIVGSELIGIVLVAGRSVRFFPQPRSWCAEDASPQVNSVLPVVAVSETSSGKTYDRRLDLAHLVDQLFADTVNVGILELSPATCRRI
jgi:hypothetical protein